MSLALGEWVSRGHAVRITGPTGAGKSWLACALAQHACRRGLWRPGRGLDKKFLNPSHTEIPTLPLRLLMKTFWKH
ncbi:MAG: ATP-binding protein [Burkholderiaceae bacterium]